MSIDPVHMKQLRLSQGISTRQLSKAIGVSSSVISKFENGERSLDSNRAMAIADALGLDDDERVVFYLNNLLYDLPHTKKQSLIVFLESIQS